MCNVFQNHDAPYKFKAVFQPPPWDQGIMLLQTGGAGAGWGQLPHLFPYLGEEKNKL